MCESVSEVTEMEKIRIELELDKQNGNGIFFSNENWYNLQYQNVSNDIKAEKNSNATAQRDSGLPDLDQPSISSLSLSCTPQKLNDEKQLINYEENDNNNELNKTTDAINDLSLIDLNFTTQNSKNGTKFCQFINNQTTSDIYLKKNSNSSTESSSTLPSSLITFNSSNSVTSACSFSFSPNTNNEITDNNKAINLRKNDHEFSTNNFQSFKKKTFFFIIIKFLDSLSMAQSSVTNASKICVGSGNINKGISRISHRLSFNSLDSGMIEEIVDYST